MKRQKRDYGWFFTWLLCVGVVVVLCAYAYMTSETSSVDKLFILSGTFVMVGAITFGVWLTVNFPFLKIK